MTAGRLIALGALAALGLGVAAIPAARAAYVVTIEQVGANVVATGSGSIDLADLTYNGVGGITASIAPEIGAIDLGTSSALDYSGFTGPTNFGAGATANADATSGNPVALIAMPFSGPPLLYVPEGYVSRDALGTTVDTFDNTTLAALGATPGSYVWTWGTAGDADSFTIDVIGAPEPATFALLGSALVGLGLSRRRKAG